MSISIVIIKPNNFEFINEKHYNNYQQLNYDLAQSIVVQSIPPEQMMDAIITNIEMIHNTDLHGDTIICYETDKHIYQVCFLMPETHPNKNDSNINKIAEYLCGEKIYGTCVVLNSKIEDNLICKPDDMNIQMLTEIIYKKNVHKGLFISCDDTASIVEYDFFKSPFEFGNNLKSEEYQYHDINLLGFTLSIFLKKTDDNPINKRVTKLIGEHKVNGDILLVSKTSYEYHDLTKDLFGKLLKLIEGPLETRKLKNEEKDNDIKINNLPVAHNKYIILENRYKTYKNECHSCFKPFEQNKYLTCTGCYRLKYHDVTCQNADWQNHKKECLKNKMSINSNITENKS